MVTQKLIQSINAIVSLTNEEWLQLLKLTEIKILKKNSYFLREGQVCESVAFVNNGTLIYFKSLENGDEITTDFAFDGDWVTDNHSRLNHSPSFINIKAIEETELLIIKNNDLFDLFYSIPKLERLGRILIEQAFIKIAQHSIDLQVLSATGRYASLLEQYPEILKNIPLHHIANYLGIAPKSLSRIRRQIFKKC
ncbi:MAG: Crp/Fnr family transcriptional regulator [Ferruginibacter sp.]|nr:Crp/Fnr family transcriptional regulator [Ferruginibacter sp.]